MAAIISSCQYCTSPATSKFFRPITPTNPFRFPNATSRDFFRRYGTRCSANDPHPFHLQKKQVEFFLVLGSMQIMKFTRFLAVFLHSISPIRRILENEVDVTCICITNICISMKSQVKSTQLSPYPNCGRKDCNFSVNCKWANIKRIKLVCVPVLFAFVSM